jgi:hypothetical protein
LAVLPVEDGLATSADGLQLFGRKQRLADSVEIVGFLFAVEKHCRTGYAERVNYVSWYCVEEFKDVLADQQSLTESVQALDFLAPVIRLQRLAPGAFGKLTGYEGCEQKREKSYPVLRVSDCKAQK